MAMGFGFMGLGEMLVALLALGGFGLQPNPKAPSVQQIVRYGVVDADYMLFADLDAVVPGVLATVEKVAKDPVLAQLPEIGSELHRAPEMLAQARAQMAQMIGMDPIRDVRWIAAWVKLQGEGDPEFLVVLSGAIPDTFLAAVASNSNQPSTRVDGRPIVRMPGGQVALGVAADGTHLFGTTAWVEARLRMAWRGSNGGEVGQFLAGKPAFALVSSPRPDTRATIRRELRHGEEVVMRDILATHEFLGLAVHHNELRWTHRATGDVAHRAAALASEGGLELMRAGHHVVRGLSRVMLAGLEVYAAKSPDVARLLKHRDVLLKFVDEHSGDGSFKAKLTVDAKTRTVAVKATGKRFAHVVPMGALLPLGAGAWLTLGVGMRGADSVPVKSQPAVVAPAPAPTGP